MERSCSGAMPRETPTPEHYASLLLVQSPKPAATLGWSDS